MNAEKATKKFLVELEKLAKEHAEFVYTPSERGNGVSCSYSPDENNPMGCIIGAAWRNATGEQLSDDGAAWYLLTERGVPEVDARFADLIQAGQDDGKPWGEAYKAACEFYGR